MFTKFLNSEWYIFFLIYCGTLFYTIASFYHLHLKQWTFAKAFTIALPLVVIEYNFSLRGNWWAHSILGYNATQIMLITLCFYFINSWLLNNFVLKHEVLWHRELVSLALILIAFANTTTHRISKPGFIA